MDSVISNVTRVPVCTSDDCSNISAFVGSPDKTYALPDSICRPCQKCGTDAWFSPVAQRSMKDDSVIFCVYCGLEDIVNRDGASVKITKDQLEEFKSIGLGGEVPDAIYISDGETPIEM